jgi:hypothetical protein
MRECVHVNVQAVKSEEVGKRETQRSSEVVSAAGSSSDANTASASVLNAASESDAPPASAHASCTGLGTSMGLSLQQSVLCVVVGAPATC